MFVQKHVLAAGSRMATPYVVVSGQQPGPVFMIVSGIHGNEPASIRAAQQLAAMFSRRELLLFRGKVVIVPLVNKKAHRRKIRGRPDLNRTFPAGRGNARATHPLSEALLQLARSHRPEWYLDLHEANGLSQKNPARVGQTLIVSPGSRATATAKRIIKQVNRTIGTPAYAFNLRQRERSGTSRMAMQRLLGARAVTVETCWSLDFRLRVDYQLQIVRAFLRSAGMLG
ncbi:M99 family carboxypeptidase catalytic domain-containing protein [Paenibacillus tepidiphilus]|uniref:M99 family carboxypeptidase catalytic domain-containing protein n=1 Tax=Paenibacillus tepidiphilus TaxID=2608683 RepID=UPI00123B3021|nr:succinylglutamate desuccinylase/aspartoacylase family protein [Paenibacillus tepidiphilus]